MDLIKSMKFNKDEFIKANKQFIYNTAYSVCKRKLQWENDDELSISLIAFNKACDLYSESKGNFYTFAKTIIRNSLIDYFRKNSKNLLLYFGDDEIQDEIYNEPSISVYDIQLENKNRAEEILAFSMELMEYKLSIENLVDSSPSHKDTRNKLLNLAVTCSNEKIITDYINKSKMLPIKQISLLTGAKTKFIESWRKYILVLVLILKNENYIYIKSYLDIKAGEITDENRNSNEN